MKILATNDDGIEGAGIIALAKILSRSHEVTIAAPKREQSGMSHAFTVRREIEVLKPKFPAEVKAAYAMDATPTDAVKIYLEAIATERPDLIVSGINDGANLATDVTYSGTVGAALEGFLHDIPVVALSRDKKSNIPFEEIAEKTIDFIKEIYKKQKLFFLNVNFPKKFNDNPKFKYCRLGKRDYINAFEKREKDGKIFFVVGGSPVDLDKSEGTDIFAVNEGNISVTPLLSDYTNHNLLENLSKL